MSHVTLFGGLVPKIHSLATKSGLGVGEHDTVLMHVIWWKVVRLNIALWVEDGVDKSRASVVG
ncbi:MAG: hypothetical protein OSA92_07875, partial [Pirellulaceae bacterium]|nr:hypothetical protein [Pirellulaceae bacterium]